MNRWVWHSEINISWTPFYIKLLFALRSVYRNVLFSYNSQTFGDFHLESKSVDLHFLSRQHTFECDTLTNISEDVCLYSRLCTEKHLLGHDSQHRASVWCSPLKAAAVCLFLVSILEYVQRYKLCSLKGRIFTSCRCYHLCYQGCLIERMWKAWRPSMTFHSSKTLLLSKLEAGGKRGEEGGTATVRKLVFFFALSLLLSSLGNLCWHTHCCLFELFHNTQWKRTPKGCWIAPCAFTFLSPALWGEGRASGWG